MNQKFMLAVFLNLWFLSVLSNQPIVVAGDNEGGSLNSTGSSLNSTGSSLTGEVSDLEGLIKDLNGRVSESEIVVPLPSDVLFDFDRADIKEEAIPTLRKLQQAISELNPEQIQIKGHTDSKGSEDYNLQLSQKRAEAIAAWLLNNTDISGDRLISQGYGETQPVAENQKPNGEDNPEGRAKNRRVEVIIPQ